MALTSKKIAALTPQEKRYVVTDTHGLTLRVHPSGTKSWCLRICHQGRVTDVTLGRWPEMGLKQARQTARQKRKSLGLDDAPLGYVFRDAYRLWCDLKKDRIVSYVQPTSIRCLAIIKT